MNTISESINEEGFFRRIFSYYKRLNIFKLYYFVSFFYFLPFLSLFIFIIDQLTINKTEMMFWVIFLVSLAPCGIIGILLSVWGLVKSFKKRSKVNKIIGFAGLFLGLAGIVAGILGIMLIYVVVN